MIDLGDIVDARARVASIIRPTPASHNESLSALAGRAVILKPEQHQRTGSFKIRGAYNLISRLEPGTEVVAASAGNHAQGVALAATRTGIRSTIFMARPCPRWRPAAATARWCIWRARQSTTASHWRGRTPIAAAPCTSRRSITRW